MKGAGKVLKVDFIEDQRVRLMLCSSSHPPPSARCPGKTRTDTVTGLSAFRELLSIKFEVSAEFQSDLPVWLQLLWVPAWHNPGTYLPDLMGASGEHCSPGEEPDM